MDPLSDPCCDRRLKEMIPPPHLCLDHSLLYPKTTGRDKDKPDWKLLRDHLHKEGRLSREDCVKLIVDTTNVFKKESNLLNLHDPVTVVGDIHGQFYDMVKMLDVGGKPESIKYLFLGDYVDRGSFSLEVLLVLYALKLNYSKTIFMLRGNHECRQMTSFFNFRSQVLYKYDADLYDLIMESFDSLPLSCLVNGKFLALHGGISPSLKSMEDLNMINRFQETPRSGLFCDVLWSDPVDNDSGELDKPFKSNEVRGCSYFYGLEAVNDFLDANNLLSVLRAHEAQLDGYKMHKWNGQNDFPVIITIFSAPNYCDVYNNKGAVIKFENNTLNIQQFNYTAHPYILPNFMDIFTWSIPFVAQKVTEMLHSLVRIPEKKLQDPNENFELSTPNSKAGAHELEGEVLKNKVRFVSRVMRMYRTLREENESIMSLKGFCPDNRIPRGLLLEGIGAIKDAVEAFKEAKKLDQKNEMRPE